MDPIKIFIGSDIYNVKAERALIYSIRKHASCPVEFHIMSRFGNDPTWKGWEKTNDWATCFSCFRWAIPAACGFAGKAIYLDSDMVVVSDIKELFDSDVSLGAATTPKRESSVMVFDCSKFANLEKFQLANLKKEASNTTAIYNFLKSEGKISFISQHWNCLDGEGWDKKKTRLIHFTKLTTQPWHPAPQKFSYVPHPHKEVAGIWLKYYEESFSNDHTSQLAY